MLQQLAMSDVDDGDPRRKSSLLKFDKVRYNAKLFCFTFRNILSY